MRVCFGCSQELKPGSKIASPPHDLVIMTRMNRQYREKFDRGDEVQSVKRLFSRERSLCQMQTALLVSTNGNFV